MDVDIQDIIDIGLSKVEFKEKLYIVEAGFDSAGEPCLHDPYTTLQELLIQISGGMKIKQILYIGHDPDKAKDIHYAYTMAAAETKKIIEGTAQ